MRALKPSSCSGTFTGENRLFNLFRERNIYDYFTDYDSWNLGTTPSPSYDGVGNRLTRVHDDGSPVTQTLTYATDSNRLATHDGETVSLDDAGNTLADPAEDLSFAYDDHNRMVEAYVDSVLQASYVYNGQGQRVKKIEATGAERTIVYHYGLSGELLGETVYSEAGAKIGERDYLWLDSLPIAQSEREFSGSTITDEAFVYLHGDQLNTPRLATDASGTVVWRWDSDAFGVGEADEDPDSDTEEVNVRLRFPGQYLDEETGLHYNYFRDYDPTTGRYLESDPIGLKGGLNTYGYALGNPVVYSDPTGEFVPAAVVVGVWAYRGYQAYRVYRTVRTATTAAAVVSGALTPVTSHNQRDKRKTVIPFPGTRSATDGDVCEIDDPDGPDECELLYNFLIVEEIKIRNDTIAPAGANEIAHAATIRARKQAWNQLANEYNTRCVSRGFPPIGYRL